ncbi:MAG TPA: helix-turn-helix domain-containing protein, partial [Clostridia bacterium]|nr:helix-turn-helix domain-containing protein [Clostridia bacterium]
KTAYVGIATTRIPLEEIAYESGFHDYSNFSRQFRAHFGKSPMDVRNSSPIGLEKYIDIRNQGG